MHSLPVRAPYPKQLIVDIHSYCNAKCEICPYPALKNELPMGVMDEKLFRKIMDDFRGLTIKYDFKGNVLFCNMGELFVYKDIAVERIRYVLGSGLEFNIQTNAALLTPDVIDILKNIGFDGAITISFHGISKDTYKKVMGLDISRTLGNIDYLLRNYPKEKIGIQSIPYHWPRGEARRVRAFFRPKGIGVRMALPNNRAGLLPEINVHDKGTLAGCKAERPLGEMVICFDGEVVLCCNDMGREEIIGNLNNSSIEEVWNGAPMMDRMEKIYCSRPSPSDFICKKCEFGVTSSSSITRLIRNARHETRKFILTRLW